MPMNKTLSPQPRPTSSFLQPGETYGSFDPNQWWQYGGIGFKNDPSQSEGPAFGFYSDPESGKKFFFDAAIPDEYGAGSGGGFQFNDPSAFYSAYQGGELSTGTEEVPQLDLPAYEAPDWIAQARERLQNFFGERMDDSYSLFSPEARASGARQVGAQVANAENMIRRDAASRGLSGSGAAEQILASAKVGGGLGLADLSARFSEADANARMNSAEALDSLRRYGAEQAYRQYATEAGVPIMMANALGPGILSGPQQENTDFANWYSVQANKEWMDQMFEQAVNEGRLGWGDILELVTSGLAGDVSVRGILTTVLGGVGAMALDNNDIQVPGAG